MSPQLEFVLKDATALRQHNPPQTRPLSDLFTMMASAGLPWLNGEPMANYDRGFASHVHALWREAKRLFGEEAAKPIADAYVDKGGEPAWSRG
jgi:hypothetical protein